MKRIVIKVGSHILNDEHDVNLQRTTALCEFLCELMGRYEVILVSSGAISIGKTKFDMPKNTVTNRQILAAIGQPYLMEIYDHLLSKGGVRCAQILLAGNDFDSRKKTLYAKNLVDGLIKNKILPIINENDATAISEIVFGDNDRLGASVAVYFDADMLVLLSDIDGYYDKNPSEFKDAKIKSEVFEIAKDELNIKPLAGSEFGTGGIITKLKAANFMLENGKDMFLASGFDLRVVRAFLLDDNQIGGTIFRAKRG